MTCDIKVTAPMFPLADKNKCKPRFVSCERMRLRRMWTTLVYKNTNEVTSHRALHGEVSTFHRNVHASAQAKRLCMCRFCQECRRGIGVCIVCKEPGEAGRDVFKCRVGCCGHFYHRQCLQDIQPHFVCSNIRRATLCLCHPWHMAVHTRPLLLACSRPQL